MKYLKKFENSALKYGEPEVIKGNQRIFTEVEIIMDFMRNLSENGVEVKSYIMNLNNGRGQTTHKIELDKNNEILGYIEENIDLKFPTFSYQISIFSSSNVDVDDIKSELEVLKSRFDEMSNCYVSSEKFNTTSKYSKMLNKKPDNIGRLKSGQAYDGEYLTTKSSDIDFNILYLNKKDDRYK